jgi:hypothetical protein
LLRQHGVGGPFRASCLAIIAAAALFAVACTGQDERLRQHRQKFESLGSTMSAIDEGWLAGDLSGTTTANALEQTLQLVEQERAALAASPESLADPRGAQLSQAAERLSRLLAATIRDVRAADAAAVRRSLADNPLMPSGPS